MTRARELFVLAAWCSGGLLCAQHYERGWWNGRAISFQAQDGWALVEGDILLAPLSEIAFDAPDPSKAAERTRQSLILTGERYRWPGGAVPYRIDPGLPNTTRVHDAIRSWTRLAPLQFVERTNETNFVTFRRSTACTANLGMRGGEQFVNLADACSTTNTIHEIGHALGLFHTQSRLDRNRFLRVLPGNILRSLREQFDLELVDSIESGPYDYGSVMHYNLLASSINGLPVFESVPPGIPLRAAEDPSPGDALAIRRAYGFPGEGVTIATHPPGLRITVDNVEVTAPRTYLWSAGEKHRLGVAEGYQIIDGRPLARYRWGRWSDEGEREHEIEVPAGMPVITASFVQELQVRTGTSGGPGSVRIEPPSPGGWYTLGSVIRVYPDPPIGMRFVRWFVLTGGNWAQGIYGRGLSQDPAEFTVDRENLTYVARFAAVPLTTVASNPTGRAILVDGQTCVTPCSYEWTLGSSHTLEAPPSQNGNAADRFLFQQWSDGGERVRGITAGNSHVTHTAEFTRQFRLDASTRIRVAASAGNRPDPSASITVAPDLSDRYYDEGSRVEISAADGDGWAFGNWSGSLSGRERPSPVVIREETVAVATLFTSPFLLTESVVHDASRQPAGVSPRQILTVYCHGLGVEAEIAGSKNEQGRFPTELGGWQVLFDDVPGEIVSIGPAAIHVLSPALAAGSRTVTLALTAPGRRGTVVLSVFDRNPAVYTADGSGAGSIAAVNEDGTANSMDARASVGTTVTFRATGLGALAEDKGPAMRPEVWIGGRPAEVISVGATEGQPEGVFDVAVRVPEVAAGGQLPVEIAGAAATSPVVTLAVR